MRFKHRSDARHGERPEGFYQPPSVDAAGGGEASEEGSASGATPASVNRQTSAARAERDGRLLRPLWWSMPVVVLALAVGIYMVALPLWGWATGRTARAGNNEAALASYSRQIYWGDLGPASWVAHYNAGTEYVKLDRIDPGVEQLRIAWDRVPKAREVADGRIETYSYECTVRMNLALALEKQGDAAMSTDRPRAASLYKEMGEVVFPCQSTSSVQQQQNQQGQGGGADADKAHERAKKKQEQAEKSGDQDQNQDKDKDKDKQDKDKDKDKQDEDKQNQDKDKQDKDQDKDKQNQDQKDRDKDKQDKDKNPYSDETEADRQKREEMQRRIEKSDQDKRKDQDRRRGTGGNGAW